MTTAATITAQLILDAAKFSSGMKDATKTADSFSKKMGDMGATMAKVGATMSLLVTAPIVAFGVASVKSAMESEAALADLDAVLKSTGSIAKVTSKQVQDYANKMQLLTKFSDEEIISGNAMLLTFTKIGKNIFPKASDATLDLAQKFGMDLSQASVMLGKALNDPISGVTALRRIGVMLTTEQEDQIKGFMAVNDIASAQGIILKELSVEVGGVAEAFGQTAAGKMAIFNNQLDQLKEALGNAIIPTLVSFMQAITPLIQKLADAPPAVQKTIVIILGLVALAGPILSVVGSILTVVSSLSSLGVGAAAAGTATAGIGISVAGLGAAFVALLPVIALVAAAILLWVLISTHGKEAMETLAKMVWLALHAVQEFGKSFMSALSNIGKAIDWLVKKIGAFTLKLLGIKLPKDLTPGSPTPFEIGLIGIANAMDKVSKNASKMGMSISSSGKDVVQGLQSGIEAQKKAIESGLKSQAQFQNNYFQNIGKLLAQNTKNQQAAMKAQAQATKISLQAQADALRKYNEVAAKFWANKGIGTSPSANIANIRTEPIRNVNVEPNRSMQSGTTNYISDNRRYGTGLSAETLRLALDDKFKAVADGIK